MKPTLFVAALLSLSQPLVRAASDYFLKIEGIDGESTDARHSGAIEISSFSWGVSNSATVAGGTGGGAGAGKVSVQDIHFVGKLDKSSPDLFISCATGQHIKKAVLHVRKAGADSSDYLVIELEDLLISSYRVANAPGTTTSNTGGAPTPEEQQSISLNFTKITFIHTTADGTVKRAGYDVALAKKI